MITNSQQLNNAGSLNRSQMRTQANELRKNGQFEKALSLYRELSKDSSDSLAAAGVLYCLRKLGCFDEALTLCNTPPENHLSLDWYKNEVIWTLIQGKLYKFNEKTSLTEITSVAETIFALQPKETRPKWSVVHHVVKRAKLKKRWDIVFEWISKINPEDLPSEPIKDKTGRDGWSEKAIWHNYQICSMIETGDRENALLLARASSDLFPRQQKFFMRLEAHANFRLRRFTEADEVYKKLSKMIRPDWWILHEHGLVLKELDKPQEALRLMCEAALSNAKLPMFVSLFADIGFLCQKMNLMREARDHLMLCKHIRNEQGWPIPHSINSALENLEKIDDDPPPDVNSALKSCRQVWFSIVPSERNSQSSHRKLRKMLRGSVIMGSSEKPFCFISSADKESFYCYKSDLPAGTTNGALLRFDAVRSFDKKKNQMSWKAINVRPA